MRIERETHSNKMPRIVGVFLLALLSACGGKPEANTITMEVKEFCTDDTGASQSIGNPFNIEVPVTDGDNIPGNNAAEQWYIQSFLTKKGYQLYVDCQLEPSVRLILCATRQPCPQQQ